ncbi:unnamed protein product [Phyllotreta striolata]|uniref:Uncharacterized protein n=1 Tax=Phyllotreta striolata TaxID=444603 RepID=A0A9N9TN39_PHYSR|nr:unnamed protein product [Phyllotreta striolata]
MNDSWGGSLPRVSVPDVAESPVLVREFAENRNSDRLGHSVRGHLAICTISSRIEVWQVFDRWTLAA